VNSDVVILADSADAGFPLTRHLLAASYGHTGNTEPNRVRR